MDAGRICAACDESMSLGLSLAGIRDILSWKKGDDISELRDWFRRESSSDREIIMLSPECGESLRSDLFERRMEGKMKPLVVIMPVEGEDAIARDLIKRAIGMDGMENAEGNQ
ncbi:MAG: hypothetical protein ACMUIG_05690 [Thermoplasmatota archaeon]